MKNKELDMLIVVNMFLTGFDATTLNTLWVDKNLKMHGLIQAFSRTNRILNSIKTFGNVVCFRNLQKRVDSAISLFGDKNAGGIVLMQSFKDYYYGHESVDGKQMLVYVDMIEELTNKFPLTEPQIIGEQNQKDFIALFGSILHMRNLLVAFDEYDVMIEWHSDAYFAKEFTKHPPNEKNLLKGKIVCGDCGKGMRLSPRTTKSYVYFCGTFSDGINPACSRHKIDQEDVNKAVFAQISNHMRCCIDALRVIRELNARSSGLKKYDVYEKAITRQRRELEKVNRKFSELYGDYSEHLINESEYLTLKQQYLLKSEALKKEIDNLLVSQNLYSKNYKIDEDWENLINKYLKCRKLNKELADAFVDKVQVFEDGRISVNLVYDDCLEELLQVKKKREGDLYE